MTENFAQLFEESLQELETRPGSIVKGTVVSIDKDIVLVDAGLKSESAIPADQFKNAEGELEIAIGDQVDVALDAVEDGFGETILSREKAKRHEAWVELEKAYEDKATIKGVINGKVKGGFTVEVNSVRAFLPGSLVDVRPVRDTTHLEGKELEFKVIKLDAKRNNVVVSRRAVIEAESSAERETLLANLEEGHEIKGIVKNLTDYGAFVDLGGVDGLLHITDMAWKRVKHPSEIVNVGDEINVKVLKFDKEKQRVSLGMKQMGNDPWQEIASRYPEGTKINGQVTNLTDYGCFVEIEDGVEGLVHVSEMDWTNKNIHPSKVVNLGDTVDVMVLEIDEERRRISLGLKQCIANPWETFAESHEKGDKVSGKIKSITDFGIFIGLDGGIDGLVHLSDISWNKSGEDAVRDYKKGDEISAVVLQVDPERERISLGVKQIEEDPFNKYLTDNKKGAIVTGTVTAVDAKGVTVNLAEEVDGYIRVADLAVERVEDATEVASVGDSIEAKFMGVDRKNRTVNLSVKAKDQADEKEAIDKVNQQEDVGFANAMAEAFKAAKGE
ncbi:30S ribosomal protein S1 [Alteromonas macleodii]|jgi:small subunit ribosomal protein S1|uniref:30S ribosomal protein S1 n=2 Tax=Alteromonas macleodii TaxID=28108 RepID=A0A1E7DDU1_ALTMA|nr:MULTISPECIES: 30S ribosomal protein S1 [Alteromonas]MDY6975325.1 30S ribosomal protein S1 [Pseudomonadota bacterium]NKW89208.1 30S ribosomal protein S1 [Alteromonadaceae bacterium A_SAG4]NKX05177.1 30S ribosomal protein S1 [Alteromonadaceae bacterium A_SAG6]NKX22246.1 30S ribosomal protein S1 [Alteromonadaceae bacterium A_SAG2]AFS37548.1 30S ribosomal protein S1 [Alteromonas macleodii ATCC 27126]|tara:strand:+ start:254 stop:1924 length:1671 start_codon:yes stop_codon:yes gene_type:complete|eukprot:PLAT5947.1.p1 GENE.PLAT5947.1~~PLAT5947.1.p1  ORF type:complete len:557 (+),score=-71.37 PLAT5947.1:350-2020(+)